MHKAVSHMRRTILLCEERCAPAWERFVAAIAVLHGEAVEVDQDEAPAVVKVVHKRVPDPPSAPAVAAPVAPEPQRDDVVVPQLGLFGGAA